jgi:hypothetical protein
MSSSNNNVPPLDFSKLPTYCPENRLDYNEETYNKEKLTRYFTNHKGKTIFIFILISIIVICLFLDCPINGDINSNTFLSKLLSLLGYLSAQLILVLCIAIFSVETYLSREEKNIIRIKSAREVEKKVNQNKNNLDFINNTINYIKRTFNISLNNTQKNSKVYVSARGDNNLDNIINNNLDNIINNNLDNIINNNLDNNIKKLKELKKLISQLTYDEQIILNIELDKFIK